MANIELPCTVTTCEYKTPSLPPEYAFQQMNNHRADNHPNPAQPNVSAQPRKEKVKRPIITPGGSSQDWAYFETRWGDYKVATNLTGNDVTVQLLECCEEELRRDLTRSVGRTLSQKTEVEILAAMKLLAIREENVMVARATLSAMRQDREEPIRSFGARVQGQADICKYVVPCTTCRVDIPFTKIMMRDVVVQGVADEDIQLELFSNGKQDMSLEEIYTFVDAKEIGKRSASHFHASQSGTVAATSSYRKQHNPNRNYSNNNANNNPINKQNDNSKKCLYCGEKGHGEKAPAKYRKQSCPAFDHVCKHCSIKHHSESMCRSKNRMVDRSGDSQGALFQQLCTITDGDADVNVVSESERCKQLESIPLDHHLYDQLAGVWKKNPSKAQPLIEIKISTMKDDYDQLGFTSKFVQSCEASTTALADTGCQSCLIGMNILTKLGLCQNDLIPVTMKMHTASNDGIKILGAVILRISGTNCDGDRVQTRQITYVTNASDNFFLSREACIQLGIISNKFPTVGENAENNLIDSATCENHNEKCDINNEPFNENCGTTDSTEDPNGITSNRTWPKRTLPPPLPTELPYPATEENREKLQQFLIDYYWDSTFNKGTDEKMPFMNCPPLTLMVDPNATPVNVTKPVPIPINWQERVKADIDRDMRLGVIEPVPLDEPVTWCHRMVIAEKSNGDLRRMIDLQPLNAHAVRETHHTQSPFHQARSIPANTKKTVSDAWNGYHSLLIREEDKHLTTFITPWGRYRYCVAVQGYISSGDGYTRRFDEIVSNIPNKTKCVDDVCMWDDDLKSAFFHACQWLDTCGRNGIIQNPDKFAFGKDTVQFAGFEITNDSVRPCQKYMKSISDFPTPVNSTDVKSWFGLINQSSYCFSMAPMMLPFRELLKPKTKFYWDEQLDWIFKQSKLQIIKEIEEGIKIYDKNKPTCLATDWSKTGLGFSLYQKHCSCTATEPFCCKEGWKLVLVGSRFTTPTEARYAPIEGEALAVAEALHKARYFVLGCKNLTVAVDHKPLLRILNNRSLDEITNPRILRLKEKTLLYRFNIVHIPGKNHYTPDALSRHPVSTETEGTFTIGTTSQQHTFVPINSLLAGIRCIDSPSWDVEEKLKSHAINALKSFQAVTWEMVKIATTSDDKMRRLVEIIETGFPEHRNDTPLSLRSYHQFRKDMYTVDGVALYKGRLIIPQSLRQEILDSLHAAHQCVTPMRARVESSIFWPGITNDINLLRNGCEDCNRNAPSQPHPPPTPPVYPTYPFQCICSDFFHHKGQYYLVSVDRYSNWPTAERVSTGGSEGLINSLRRLFSTFGIPDELSSDGGPEFIASKTKLFLKNWGVRCTRLSSVAYPHSNCRAELGVKTVKRMIMDNTGVNGSLDVDAFQRAILQYRNAPDQQTSLSPAMIVFGRAIKDFIPILPGKYEPHNTWCEMLHDREIALRARHLRASERLSAHTKRLSPLVVGDLVRIQNQTGPNPTKWDRTGKVIEVKQFDQYNVRIDGSGRITLRNRQFLRKYEPINNNEKPIVLRTPTPTVPHLTMAPYSSPQPESSLPSSDDLTPVVPVDETRPPIMESNPTPLEVETTTLIPTSQTTTEVETTTPPTLCTTTPAAETNRRSTRTKYSPKWMEDFKVNSLTFDSYLNYQ